MTRLLSLLIAISVSFYAHAQNITGGVFEEDGSPIVGAYILKLSSEVHTHTNSEGKFEFMGAEVGDTLQVTYLGFETIKFYVEDLTEERRLIMKEAIFDLEEIVIGQHIKKINLISDVDMQLNPVNSSQEILSKVPGLFIGQHAGGGKAEQIFLRGFDIDHGTDVAINVDGMPVNMVSHAHGQGYADLHFVIPETVDYIDFGKGPYYADKGNFATAGYVGMRTKEKLDNSSIAMEVGQFGTFRAVGLLDILSTKNHNVYLASEFMLTDGPVESPQNFNRRNIMLRYSGKLNEQDKISFIASHFASKWDASGQIPQRAVESGQITRFGTIDDTEGGETSRTNFGLKYNRTLSNQTFIKNNVFYSLYGFELFSNFTFFLDDPVNGDQIRQVEERQIFGAETELNHSFFINDHTSGLFQGGVGLRYDNIDGNQLAHTLNRKTTLNPIKLGDVDETNLYAYAKTEFDFGKLLVQPGLRLDYFEFHYVDNLQTAYETQSDTKALLSPKLNVVYNANRKTQLFFKSGVGFHSNDSRVVVLEKDKPVLPTAYGADIGATFKVKPRLIVNTALWYLFLQQEFVYVGDAGIVEPSGRTERMGIDVGMRWQLADWLFANVDVNYALPRSLDDPEGENYIPLAPQLTSTGGLNWSKRRITGGLRYRYLKDRPANEDNSIVAKGYFITDMNLNYAWQKVTIGFAIENLLNQEWNETQFATESRLDFEAEPVEEIHFTPGTPFFFKVNIQYKF